MSTTPPTAPAVRRMMKAVRDRASNLSWDATDWSAATWQTILYAASTGGFDLPRATRTPTALRIWCQAHRGFYERIRQHLAHAGLALPDPGADA